MKELIITLPFLGIFTYVCLLILADFACKAYQIEILCNLTS